MRKTDFRKRTGQVDMRTFATFISVPENADACIETLKGSQLQVRSRQCAKDACIFRLRMRTIRDT